MSGEHSPRAFPICTCGDPATHHRPSHKPKPLSFNASLCECGALVQRHRVKHKFKPVNDTTCECGLPKTQHLTKSPREKSQYRIEYVGIDGEGIGRRPHKYVLLCAATEDGRHWELEDLDGLGTQKALNWILNTLDRCRVFSYSFGYDITCILKDLPDRVIFELLRPSMRYSDECLQPVTWEGFNINWLQGQLTIKKDKKRVVIWDIYKFFQAPFVKAITSWGISTEAIEDMKAQRNAFRVSMMPKIRAYCLTECRQLATLSRKLIEAHRETGLTLRSYYGPGSTASVAITKMKALKYRGKHPKAMREAIACAFFGGRFEHSAMGSFAPIYGYDISSAYPYQLYQLPCLKHGKWTHVTGGVRDELQDCTTALVRYRYNGNIKDTWAPLPHRSPDGSICYPAKSIGWLWLPEILSALRLKLGRLELLEAWVFRSTCKHRPFAAVAAYYRRRVEIGKDAAGIVLKLACNSIYGKLAQSKGPKPKFQSWIWAGLVTSGTRAMILDAIGTARNRANIVAIATDGIYSRERLSLPKPIETGTNDLPKPLGGWEEKIYEDGMLFIKPGIYQTLCGSPICRNCTHGTVRARGIGRKSLLAAKDDLLAAWEAGQKQLTITVDRFHGAKTSISQKLKRSPRYGQWSQMPIRIAFACPNRAEDMTLLERLEPSTPYSRSLLGREKVEALISEAIAYEQP